MRLLRLAVVATLLSLSSNALSQTPGGTAISYQGQLKQSGQPYSGSAGLTFDLYATEFGGVTLGTVNIPNQTVVNGLFTAALDFGASEFSTNESRWVEVTVDGNRLAPRQRLAAAPFSLATRGINVAANGNIGIGAVPLPDRHLQIAGGGWSEGRIRLKQTDPEKGDCGGIEFAGADNQVTWYVGASLIIGPGGGVPGGGFEINRYGIDGGNALYIDPNGNVTIGYAASNASFTVRGTTTTRILQITGGADVAEPFIVRIPDQPACEETIEPGMVVAIDTANPGGLLLATEPYDRKVSGVISGANGLSPGMVLRSCGDAVADGNYPVALTGRVWCWCDASYAPIEPGDRLTSSATPGHAMKVIDRDRADGAVIGKAMTRLESGRGLVLLLVQPQ